MTTHLTDTPGASALLEAQMRAWEQTRQKWAREVRPARRTEVAEFVCISRVFGAGGSDVASELGRRLGWPVFDKQILGEMAGDDRIRARLYESMDERDTDWVEELIQSLTSQAPSREEYFHRLSGTILSLARQGHAIFLGRAADLVLPRSCGLRVRIAAPLEYCVRHYADRHKITRAEARAAFERIEGERDAFIRRHFAVDPHEPSRHDLVINLERFNATQAAELIQAAMDLRGILPEGVAS